MSEMRRWERRRVRAIAVSEREKERGGERGKGRGREIFFSLTAYSMPLGYT